jgi:hypothetical protein
LSPRGFAADGEVEDHVLTIIGNPWRNSTNGFDVNGDTFVTAIDALTLVNDYNKNGPRQLPIVPNLPIPPYLDVDGDTLVTATGDILSLVNYLNGLEGEGESRSPVGSVTPEFGEGEGPIGEHDVSSAGLLLRTSQFVVFGSGSAATLQDGTNTTVVDHRISSSTVADHSVSDSVAVPAVSGTSRLLSVADLADQAEEEDIDLLAESFADQQQSDRPLTALELIFQDEEI